MQVLINDILYEFLKKFAVIYLNNILIYFNIKKVYIIRLKNFKDTLTNSF
jgi:chemotaxis methyl-accepting protein methylase